MNIKTSELEGVALNWVVAQCVGEAIENLGGDLWRKSYMADEHPKWFPSNNWQQAGPIIEAAEIGLMPPRLRIAPNGQKLGTKEDGWFATLYSECDDGQSLPSISSFGSTPLIAALRCYVTRKLGEVVDVPKELLT